MSGGGSLEKSHSLPKSFFVVELAAFEIKEYYTRNTTAILWDAVVLAYVPMIVSDPLSYFNRSGL